MRRDIDNCVYCDVQMALFTNRKPHAPDSDSFFHSALDWRALLSSWETAEAHVNEHRRELGND